jgi:RecB family exonuclease
VLRDPRDLAGVPDRVAGPAKRLAGLLAQATAAIDAGGNAEDVLWAIWHASGLAEQWQRTSAAGGPTGAAADRDLDAVLALFDQAAHFTDTMPPGAPGLFAESLAGQEIVGDTLAERAVQEDCVRILTAHRSKGLEWEVVVVAGVQEDTWPDLRLRGSLLGAGELAETVHSGLAEAGHSGLSGPEPGADVDAAMLAAKLLAEERRLFYVAVTRARRRLVVTAAGGEDTDQRPSRFLTELAGDDVPVERVADAPHRWLSMPALVADLRRAAADTSAERAVRQAAAAQLARLAAAGVRAAHPRDWYALTELSDAGPIVAGGETVRLSPSQVESFTKCGLRWLLEAAVGAGRSDVLRHLGTVIHAAAVLAADGATERDVADRIDEIWHHLDFGSAWYSAKQRALAERMVRKFLAWHAENPRELVAVEQQLKVRIGPVEITGRVDRLESDDQGRAVVVDLKTGGSAPREDELDRHPQLGVYQLAVLLGAFERLGLAEPGGAELVQVGKASGVTMRAKVQRQGALAKDPEPGWAKDLVETVAAGMAGPLFEAKVVPARSPPAARSTPKANKSPRDCGCIRGRRRLRRWQRGHGQCGHGQCGQCLAGRVRDRREQLVPGQYVPERGGVGDVVRLLLRHGDIGHHPGALPVRTGDRVDRARERYRDVHGGADREWPGRVRAAAGRLADHLCPAHGLQRVGEVLAAGKRPAAGQHVDRPVEVAGARHVGQRPELMRLTGIGPEDVVEMSGRLLIDQVAAPVDHALG